MTYRTRTAAAILAVITLAAGACSSGHGSTIQGLGVQAAPTSATTAAPTTTPAQKVACDASHPTGSFKASPLSPPGQMPAGSYMRHIQDQGHLTVGVSQSTYLFGFLNPGTGNIEGFDVDILKQVAKAIFGDKPDAIQYKAVTSAQRIPYVKDGTVDIVAATMTINCARWQQVDFSTEYYHAGQKALVPQTSAAATTDALKGHKVCAAAGSTSIDNITTKLSAVPVSVSDWTDCLVALQHGQVDAISTDDTILAGLKAQDPYTRIVAGPNGEAFTNEPYGMAISQDHPEFVGFVNGVLDQIRANGTWANIYVAWVGRLFPGVPTPPPPTAVYTR